MMAQQVYECECGNPRAHGAAACGRCLALDGDWQHSITESEIISALQQAGEPIDATEIAELVGIERRTVDIRMPALVARGRVVKRMKAGTGRSGGDVTLYALREAEDADQDSD